MTLRKTSDVLIFYDRPDTILAALRSRFPAIRFHACTRYDDLTSTIKKTRPQIIFATKFELRPFPRQVLVEAPGLEWLAIGFAGVDHVVPWDDERLVVTNAAGVASHEIAQYVVAAIYAMHQRFPLFARQQARHEWRFEWIKSARHITVGIIGLGHTGRAVAELCRANGFNVVACRSMAVPSPNVDRVYTISDLHDMLHDVDVTVVCAALTDETRDLFGAAAFASMRPGAFFVNVARGALVDETALIEALQSGHLGGAYLDVARTEPLPLDDPLWDAPNCFITPHTSSEYDGWTEDAAAMFADNLSRWLEGGHLANQVYSKRGY